MTKTAQVQSLIAAGDRKGALKMASDFRGGITTEQRKALKKGYECIVWPEQYRQMKVDVEAAVESAWALLKSLPVINGV
jgi:hypothetical protein